jgi:hypothetical protein
MTAYLHDTTEQEQRHEPAEVKVIASHICQKRADMGHPPLVLLLTLEL